MKRPAIVVGLVATTGLMVLGTAPALGSEPGSFVSIAGQYPAKISAATPSLIDPFPESIIPLFEKPDPSYAAAKGTYPFAFDIKSTAEHRYSFGSDELYEVRCELATFKGTLRGENTTVSAVPSYSGCAVYLEGEHPEKIGVSVEVSHCEYEFLEPKLAITIYEIKMNLISTGGTCKITFKSSAWNECTITIGAQGPILVSEGENIGAPPTGLKISFRLESLTYTHSGMCACPSIGTGKDGGYKGISSEVEGIVIK
jgi:hypothetical protein